MKTDCTNKFFNKFFIPKLSENSSFHNSTITHVERNGYQVTSIFMKNQGNSLKINEIIKIDEHKFILIENRLHK